MSYKLPSSVEAFHDYVEYHDVKIPMRDGVELSADIFFPSKDGVVDFTKKYPVIMQRSAYIHAGGHLGTFIKHLIYYAAENGYAFVNNSSRGTHLSGGEFGFMKDEMKDGADTLKWIVEQPWSNGKVVTSGQSWGGGTQYALLLSGETAGLEGCVVRVPAMNSACHGWLYTEDFFDTNTAPAWAAIMGIDLALSGHYSPEIAQKILADIPLLGDLAAIDWGNLYKSYSLRELPIVRHLPFYQTWLDNRDKAGCSRLYNRPSWIAVRCRR